MLKVEEWLLIRDLYSQGFSISEISRRTGHARETVRKYLHKKHSSRTTETSAKTE